MIITFIMKDSRKMNCNFSFQEKLGREGNKEKG